MGDIVAPAVVIGLVRSCDASRLLRRCGRRYEGLNDDQEFCVETASRWMDHNVPDHLIDMWLLAACSPKTAKHIRYVFPKAKLLDQVDL